MSDNQIAFYQAPDGSVNIEVLYAEENIWLTQKKMAELFDTTVPNVNMHLKNLFEKREINKDSVIKDFLTTASDGKEYKTKMYSLEAIIAVGYRVNSERGTQFRQWATGILKNYIHKGYEIKDIRTSERNFYQKVTDIYAISKAEIKITFPTLTEK